MIHLWKDKIEPLNSARMSPDAADLDDTLHIPHERECVDLAMSPSALSIESADLDLLVTGSSALYSSSTSPAFYSSSTPPARFAYPARSMILEEDDEPTQTDKQSAVTAAEQVMR